MVLFVLIIQISLRKISDNVLFAHELVRNYHRHNDGCYALKVEIQKHMILGLGIFLRKFC